MKNRAKCKICNSIIESFYDDDYVTCKCKEIYVDGGASMRCGASKWDNFVRVDDNGNEVVPKIKEKNEQVEEIKPISRQEKLKMLEDMIEAIENLPKEALHTYVTHYDLLSSLIVLFAILKDDCKLES